jgi:hypothetical protein
VVLCFGIIDILQVRQGGGGHWGGGCIVLVT